MATIERMDRIDETKLIQSDILAFIDRNQNKELLRFVTVGSVDDGKSTLIGRLLHDTKGVYDDQLKDATRTSETGEEAIDFARLTDGLRAEREQGITIDVAYRYFSTPVRKFIIADTPGHVQYTRNMATGASTANVAIILIDARLGVLQQSRRHAYIASLLGIPHLFVGVNKMDLVDYERQTFEDIKAEFEAFSADLGFTSVSFVPISALMGVNVVETSETRTPWYDGPSVLEYLETVPISRDRNFDDFRYPVQTVIRPNLDYRGFAGQIASGVVKVGDELRVLPGGQTSKVTHIDTWEGEQAEAFAPMSVCIRLADEIDCSRGDLLMHASEEVFSGRNIDAMVVWMSETPLDPDRSYMVKHMARYVRTDISEVAWQVDLDTLEQLGDRSVLKLNDIGLVRFTMHQPLHFDAYKRNRTTGAMIIIDSMTNNTVGAAMIVEPEDLARLEAEGGIGGSQVSRRERAARLNQIGTVVALKGDTEQAFALERRLWDRGWTSAVTDDAAVAGALAAAGLVAIVATESSLEGAVAVTIEGEGERGVDAAVNQLVDGGVLIDRR